MSYWIRERAPLRLSIEVVPILRPPISGGSGGVATRWGTDDRNPETAVQNLEFSTVMPGGFENLTFNLQRDPRRQYPDLVEFQTLVIRGSGGSTVAEFRLEDLPSTGGFNEQISPQCPGWQSHLADDNSAAMVYVDQNLTAWQGPSLKRQIALNQANFELGNTSVGQDKNLAESSVSLEVDGDWVSPYRPIAEAWYDSQGAGLIDKIYYSIDFNNAGDANWIEDVGLSSDDIASVIEISGNLATGSPPRTGYFAGATAYRYAFIQHYYNITPAGSANATFVAYVRPAVYGDHNITPVGPDPGGLLASDVVGHAVGRWAPKLNYSTGEGGTIRPSQFIIPQLVFTPTTVAEMIKSAVQYELLDWAVWEDKTFYLNERNRYARQRFWRARIGPAQLQQAGQQVSRMWNGVVIQWQDVDGTVGIIGPPGTNCPQTDDSLLDSDPENLVTQAGLNKFAYLQMQGIANRATAIQIGAIFLREQKLLNTSGQATLVGHVEDMSGVLWPAWTVRAGDQISFVDANDASYRRIIHTQYSDDSKSNTIQLDQPPDSLTALLERLNVALSPLGLN